MLAQPPQQQFMQSSPGPRPLPNAHRYPPPNQASPIETDNLYLSQTTSDFDHARGDNFMDWLLLKNKRHQGRSADGLWFEGSHLASPPEQNIMMDKPDSETTSSNGMCELETCFKEGEHQASKRKYEKQQTGVIGTGMQAVTIAKHEKVFYNSAKAKRSCLGHTHYCISCPGWNKVTNVRYVYSRWEWGPLEDATCCCCCAWCPCGSIQCINGRQLDQFNSDLIVDMSAHQNLCQVCRGEGDMVVHKLAGGDLSTTLILVLKSFHDELN